MSNSEHFSDRYPNEEAMHQEGSGSRLETTAFILGNTILHHFWCPYCGGWHGSGPPPGMRSTESTIPIPPLPDVIGRLITRESAPLPNMVVKERGVIDGEPAKINTNIYTGKVDVYWGGENRPDGGNHGHLVSHDDQNADFVAEPGAGGLNRDIPVDNRRVDPYDQDSPRYRYDEESGGYIFGG